MKQTEPNIGWAVTKLQILSGLDGFPRTIDGLRGIAIALLDIVDDQPECWEDQYDTTVGHGVRRMARPEVAAEETVDWLLARVSGCCRAIPGSHCHAAHL